MVVVGVIILLLALLLPRLLRVLFIMNESSTGYKQNVRVLILRIILVLVSALITVLKSIIFQYEL